MDDAQALQDIKQLIVLFLRLNPEPSDAQVHALADSLGVDSESLEAIVYRMLGRVVNACTICADSQEILEDAIPVEQISVTDMAFNDGDPMDDDAGLQEETTDDGIDALDTGLGSMQDVLNDDGVVIPPSM